MEHKYDIFLQGLTAKQTAASQLVPDLPFEAEMLRSLEEDTDFFREKENKPKTEKLSVSKEPSSTIKVKLPLKSDASPVLSVIPYQEKIDLLRRHQSQLLEYLNKFKLALDADEPEVKTAYSIMVKPWISLSKLVEQRERTLIELGRYFKKVRYGKVVSFDLNPLERPAIPVPDWSCYFFDACCKEMEHLIHLLQSIESDPTYAAYPLVHDIPALINVISSLNIPVAHFSNSQVARSSPSETETSTLTPIVSPYGIDGSTVKTSRLSAESPTFTFVSPIWRCFIEVKPKLEAMMLRLNPLLVSLLSFSEDRCLSAQLSDLTQDAQDLWLLMQQVSQWTARISMDTLGVNLFEDSSVMLLPEQRIPVEIISPFYSSFVHDLKSIIETWNREINHLALTLKEISHEDSCSQNLNMEAFIKQLSFCYFYERNIPVYRYLQDVFGALGIVEVFGAQLFMKDNCDIDVRLIWNAKQATEESVTRSVLDALIRKNPYEQYRIKVRQYYLIQDTGPSRVISIKLAPGSNSADSIDLSVFIDGFPESKNYISHAAASLNLKTGRLRCDHDFFRNILDKQFIIRGEVSPYANPLSRELHILKFLIRAYFVPASYLGSLSLLEFGPEAVKIEATLKKYGADLFGLKQANPLLEKALRTLIQRHFKDDHFTLAFLNRSVNLLRFCQRIGFRLIAFKSHEQFELVLGAQPVRMLQLNLIREGVKEDHNRSLFFELTPGIEACLSPSPQLQQAMLGLFRVKPGSNLMSTDDMENHLSSCIKPGS